MLTRSTVVLLSLAALLNGTAAKPCDKPSNHHGSNEHTYPTKPTDHDAYSPTSRSTSSAMYHPIVTPSSQYSAISSSSTASTSQTSSSASSSVSSSSSSSSTSSISSSTSSTSSDSSSSNTESSTSSSSTSSTISSTSSTTSSMGPIVTPPPMCVVEGGACTILRRRIAVIVDPVVNDPCCDGLTCQGGFCAVPEPKPICVADGALCVVGALPCCNVDFTCNGAVCQAPPPPTCSPRFGSCENTDDCCGSDECAGSMCVAPVVIPVPEPVCIADGEACPGPLSGDLCCNEASFCDYDGTRTCRVRGPDDSEPVCIADGGLCVVGSGGLCCTGGYECNNGMCAPTDGNDCIADDRTCTSSDTCCTAGYMCLASGLCDTPPDNNPAPIPCSNAGTCFLDGFAYCTNGFCSDTPPAQTCTPGGQPCDVSRPDLCCSGGCSRIGNDVDFIFLCAS